MIYGKFPVLLSGLTESISRNGLKFISGTIAYLPDEKDAAVKIAETYGSLFPSPSSRNTGLGFWELNFQAVIFTGEKNILYGTESVTIESQNELQNYSIKEKWLVGTLTEFTVINSDESVTSLPSMRTSNGLMKKRIDRKIQGTLPAGVTGNLNISWATEIKSITRRNFGILDECDIVYGAVANIL